MKILSVLTVLFVAINLNTTAQSVTRAQFPDFIVKKVTQKFPDVEDIDWRMKNNLYEVEVDGPDKSNTWLRFDHEGNLLAQKEYISPAFMPGNISKLVSEKYSKYKTLNTERMKIGDKTYYQVSLKGKGPKYENLVFSDAGELTNEVLFWN